MLRAYLNSSWNPYQRCFRSFCYKTCRPAGALILQAPFSAAGGNALMEATVTQDTFCFKARNNFPRMNWRFLRSYLHVPTFENEAGSEGVSSEDTHSWVLWLSSGLSLFFFPPMKAWWEREKGRKEQFLFSICFHRNTEIKRKKRLLTSSCPYTCQHSSEQQPWSFLQHLFSIKVYI